MCLRRPCREHSDSHMELELFQEMYGTDEFWVIEPKGSSGVVTFAFSLKPRTGVDTNVRRRCRLVCPLQTVHSLRRFEFEQNYILNWVLITLRCRQRSTCCTAEGWLRLMRNA